MRLQDELFKSANGWTGARYTVAVQGGGYFQGVKAVGDFSPQNIVLYCPNAWLEVQGEGLIIRKYADGDLELGGKIVCVRTESKEDGNKA